MSEEKNLRSFFEMEYKTAADAHFNVSQRVTNFFQYILVIYSAPLILFTDKVKIEDSIKGLIFVSIAIIGFFVCMYISRLRFEAILYSRTVNGIRRYIYDNNKEQINLTKYNVLAFQTEKPPFYDRFQFIWIVLVLALVNSGYIFSGLYLLKNFVTGEIPKYLPSLIQSVINIFTFLLNVFIKNETYIGTSFVIMVLYYFFHVYKYSLLAKEEETGANFYEHRIGVDIDGVLNNHTEQFCKIMLQEKDIVITPEQITAIPVRYAISNIEQEHEDAVFNCIKYWEDMPARDDISYLDRIKDMLGYEIFIFTWREWGKSKYSFKDIVKNWNKRNYSNHSFNIKDEIVNWFKGIFRINIKFDIQKITKRWLINNSIQFDKIFFESGNLRYPVKHKNSLVKNRFYWSKKYKIKFFIEDDLQKALSLSNICKYVFLIDHKYNQCDILPYNVIRVNEWREVFETIKELG